LILGPKKNRSGKLVSFLITFVAIVLVAILLYNVPFINDRLAWRVEALRAEIQYALKPPEEIIFQPNSSNTPGTPDQAITPTTTQRPRPTQAETLDTPTPSPTITPSPTPLPTQAYLSGFKHQYQTWNNCGPANLAMALSYWGWEGDQRDTAAFTKPNPRDKNVMPYEMEDFIIEQTDLSSVVRVGGDLETLKAFIAAGFPVIVEKSFEGPRFDGWMGHYEVVNGYDDSTQLFTVQDSYDGPDLNISYQDMLSQWQAFNYTYIVVYPSERGQQVLSILGAHQDPTFNFQQAAQIAEREANSLSGREKYFALYNLGSNLARLHDYTAAATAFDAAFANYPSIPENLRPWRMLWYQTGPYFAYYYSGRYQDVIDLATTTLDAMSEPILEESYYWRAMAEVALGDVESAIKDLRASLQHHPGFVPSIELLRQLGEEP